MRRRVITCDTPGCRKYVETFRLTDSQLRTRAVTQGWRIGMSDLCPSCVEDLRIQELAHAVPIAEVDAEPEQTYAESMAAWNAKVKAGQKGGTRGHFTGD